MTALPDFPFRRELRSYPGGLIEPQELARLQQVLGSGSYTEVEGEVVAWAARHPVEQVRWLLATRIGSSRSAGQDPEIRHLIHSALQEAEEEGVLWTPLLDRLSTRPAWSRLAGEERERGEGALRSPFAQMERITQWLKSRKSPEEVEPLFTFESPLLREAMAQHVPCLSPVQRQRLEREHAVALVRNPSLPPGEEQEIAERALREWSEILLPHARSGRLGEPALKGMEQNRLREVEKLWGVVEERGEGLREPLLRRGYQVALSGYTPYHSHLLQRIARAKQAPAEMLEGIFEREWGKSSRLGGDAVRTTLVELLKNPRTPERVWGEMMKPGQFEESVLMDLLNSRDSLVGAERLLWLVERFRSEPARLASLAEHPNAHPEVWKRVIEHSTHTAVLQALAENAGARHVPEVRAVLLRSRSQYVMDSLLRDCSSEEFPLLFNRLLKVSEETALRVLERGIPAAVRLPKSLLARLLGAEREELRLRTIRLLRHQGVEFVFPKKDEPRTPSPRGRTR